MKPEELKVGMWLASDSHATSVDALSEDRVYYTAFRGGKRIGSTSWSRGDFCDGERLATAAEVREHVPESEWPQWVKDGGPNPHAKPAADEDGLVWFRLREAGGESAAAWVIKNDKSWPVALGKGAGPFKSADAETPYSALDQNQYIWIPRPDWLTPAQLVEIKRLLGVEANHITDAGKMVALPWGYPEELRTVDGQKIHSINRGLTGGWTFDIGDNNHGPCLCDEFGRLRGTDIPIIRLATAAEMEAERPKVRPWTWETAPGDGMKVLYKQGDIPDRRNACFRPKHVTLYHSHGIDKNVSYEDLAKYGTQLDGSPCGIVEGGGE